MGAQIVGMVLAGGRVDELLVLTAKRPKSAVPIWGMYRFIDFALSNMMHSGIDVVGLLSQYRPYSLNTHLANGSPWDYVGRRRQLKVLSPYSGSADTDWYRGTADAIWQNLNFVDHFSPELVLIASGDHVSSMDYRPLVRQHRTTQADLTIVLKRVPQEQAAQYGTAVLDGDGRVLRYEEKAPKPASDLASLTVYLFAADVLARRLEENQREGSAFQLYSEVLPRMVAEGDRVFGYVHEGYWQYARTLDGYYDASLDILRPQAPDLAGWQVRTNVAATASADPPPALFGADGLIVDSLVCAGCSIAGEVRSSVLSPWVTVERGAVVRSSVLMDGCHVAAGAVVERAILDKQVTVGRDARIGGGKAVANRSHPDVLASGAVVVGKATRIPAGCEVGSGAVLAPDIGEARFAGGHVAAGATVEP